MKERFLSIEEWAELVQLGADDAGTVPMWVRVISGSMLPFIRANKDDILLVPVKPDELKIGDIVLFPIKHMRGDYCLHRVYKMKDNLVQTFGDNCRTPDVWMPKEKIIGKAILIKHGRITIDCEKIRWKIVFKVWTSLWRVRGLLRLPLRVAAKIKRGLFGKN
ncbi:MAG: hypothetical protein Q4C78_00030 [Synergistaceae bacterium]|nr:hypothetical protein [Synergistaceae bacterium]